VLLSVTNRNTEQLPFVNSISVTTCYQYCTFIIQTLALFKMRALQKLLLHKPTI